MCVCACECIVDTTSKFGEATLDSSTLLISPPPPPPPPSPLPSSSLSAVVAATCVSAWPVAVYKSLRRANRVQEGGGGEGEGVSRVCIFPCESCLKKKGRRKKKRTEKEGGRGRGEGGKDGGGIFRCFPVRLLPLSLSLPPTRTDEKEEEEEEEEEEKEEEEEEERRRVKQQILWREGGGGGGKGRKRKELSFSCCARSCVYGCVCVCG